VDREVGVANRKRTHALLGQIERALVRLDGVPIAIARIPENQSTFARNRLSRWQPKHKQAGASRDLTLLLRYSVALDWSFFVGLSLDYQHHKPPVGVHIPLATEPHALQLRPSLKPCLSVQARRNPTVGRRAPTQPQ
jgi:hypothetical protein